MIAPVQVSEDAVLRVEELRVSYDTPKGEVKAVDRISFSSGWA
jgi:ABC-type glutathione transport system ATPase component